MQKAKVNVLIALFAYGGNGGVASLIPQLAVWLAIAHHKMKLDERIDKIGFLTLSDTPITMTRNLAVKAAVEGGFDMLLMLDSDNEPDGYVGKDRDAKPFWDVAFDHAYNRLLQGKPTIIAAPYCGPPPHPVPRGLDYGEVPYLFEWVNNESDVPRPQVRLDIMDRTTASKLRGIVRVAALPTGVSLWTTSVFEGMKRPIFDYQFSADGSTKETTEDVFATRNASLFWGRKIRENIVFAACDSWALHYKPKKVGRPSQTTVEWIADDFAEAVRQERSCREVIHDLDLPDDAPLDPTLPAALIDDQPEGKPAWHEYAMGEPEHRRAVADLVRAKSDELGRKLQVVEVGSWLGGSAIAMADTDCVEKLICVDTWRGAPDGDILKDLVAEAGGHEAVYQEFLSRIGHRFRNPIHPVRCESVKAAGLMATNGAPLFDLIYLDGDHTKAGLLADIEAWWPLLAEGGILAGHDYKASGFPGVSEAVAETFGDDVDCVGFAGEEAGGIFVVRKESARQAIDDASGGPFDDDDDEEEEDESDEEGLDSEEATQISADPPIAGGIAVKPKQIGGRRVSIFDYEVPDADLAALKSVVHFMIEQHKGAALEVAVLHPDTGQTIALMLPVLPEGSRVYGLGAMAFDARMPLVHEALNQTFGAEIENRIVTLDVTGRHLPQLDGLWGFDLVVVERVDSADMLRQWSRQVRKNGALVGLWHGDPAVLAMVREFAEETGAHLRTIHKSGVWFIAMSTVGRKAAEVSQSNGHG